MSDSSSSSNIARRNLSQTIDRQSRTLERLSSGLRINKVSDDAAGLALASSAQAKSRVYAQAQRNVADGTSFLNVAESAANELKNIIERQKSLAGQATNSNLTSEQRALLDSEFQALGEQYNSIISNTEINGQRVFDSRTLAVQAGVGIADSIAIELDTASAHLPTGTYNVSTTQTGAQGNGVAATSGIFSMSSDGRYIVFNAASDNLVSGDVNGVTDVFWKDTQTGEIRLVSKTAGGVQGDGNSTVATISDDGRYVAYSSASTTFSGADTNGLVDQYVTDMVTGVTTLVSSSSAGVVANAASTDARISGDGRYVVFQSAASNLVAGDTNGVSDIFMKDTVTGVTTRISVSDGEVEGNGAATASHISDDGRYVSFLSAATNLVAGDSNGFTDAFVRDTVLGTTTRVSVSTAGVQATANSEYTSMSSDGRYVLFYSLASNLTTGDVNGARDVFIRDTVSGTTELVSLGDSEQQGNSSSYFGTISDDGRFVAFISQATNLTAATDVNGAANDVFVRDRQLGTTTWISAGGNGTSQGSVISNDGRYVTLTTAATNLISGDTNGVQDILIFRSDGGSAVSGVILSEQHGSYLTTEIGAGYALETLEDFDDELTLFRGIVSAGLSRLNVAESASEVRAQNYRAAADQIMDADMAVEVADAARQKILIRSGVAIVAQANQQPGVVLQLLMEN